MPVFYERVGVYREHFRKPRSCNFAAGIPNKTKIAAGWQLDTTNYRVLKSQANRAIIISTGDQQRFQKAYRSTAENIMST